MSEREIPLAQRSAILERALISEVGRRNMGGDASWDAWRESSAGKHPPRIIERTSTTAIVVKGRWSGWLWFLIWTLPTLGALFWVYPLYRLLTRRRNRDKFVHIEVTPAGEVLRTRLDLPEVLSHRDNGREEV